MDSNIASAQLIPTGTMHVLCKISLVELLRDRTSVPSDLH